MEFSASMKSSLNWAVRWCPRARARSASGLPAFCAFSMSVMRSTTASIARLRNLKVRSWIFSTRALSSASGMWWQVWQARLMLSIGLRT